MSHNRILNKHKGGEDLRGKGNEDFIGEKRKLALRVQKAAIAFPFTLVEKNRG